MSKSDRPYDPRPSGLREGRHLEAVKKIFPQVLKPEQAAPDSTKGKAEVDAEAQGIVACDGKPPPLHAPAFPRLRVSVAPLPPCLRGALPLRVPRTGS
jgi:hypothetical protein